MPLVLPVNCSSYDLAILVHYKLGTVVRGVYYQSRLTTFWEFPPNLGRQLLKNTKKNLKFTGKAKKGVYTGFFKGAQLKNYSEL